MFQMPAMTLYIRGIVKESVKLLAEEGSILEKHFLIRNQISILILSHKYGVCFTATQMKIFLDNFNGNDDTLRKFSAELLYFT